MKAGYPCKLFGAQQALTGIRDAAVLLHSVVGCNFSTMGFHFTGCDMSELNQTCTVLSDSDIVFSGEESLDLALNNIRSLYEPQVIFVLQGCVSDIIQDDIATVCRRFEEQNGLRVIPVEAAGYRGNFKDGYEAALSSLLNEMKPCRTEHSVPRINLIGLGADDWRLRFDIEQIRTLLSGKAELGTVFGRCRWSDIVIAADADLNLVIGNGTRLAEQMKERFGIPYECIQYPYGLCGADELWNALSRRFSLDFTAERESFKRETALGVKPIYSYMQNLYGIPCAVIGQGARAQGMARFLSAELGMEVEVLASREEHRDIGEFYALVRQSESAVLFGSSFEQELADEMEIPLFRFDYPVFDRVCITDRPYVGAKGTLCLIEDLFDEIIHARHTKGALYQ